MQSETSGMRKLTYSELNNRYVKLKYKLRIQRVKSRQLHEKYRSIYNRFWTGYDFIVGQFNNKHNSVNNADTYTEHSHDTDSFLPF